jgi:hypothetical protein
MRRFALPLAFFLAASSSPLRADEPTANADPGAAGSTAEPTPTPTTAPTPTPSTPSTSTASAQGAEAGVLDTAMQAAIEAIVERRLEERLAEKKSAGFFDDEKLPVSLSWRGDFFTKFLVRNNQSGGCVSYGNPSPEGDNFSGDNGICSELGLTVVGRVSDRVEAGARRRRGSSSLLP